MTESYPLCLDEACGVMNQYFEQMIISKPNQYMWSYNRYKRPHGAEIAPII
jgi:KDO2-lipid IV(A) lauroyltransferase